VLTVTATNVAAANEIMVSKGLAPIIPSSVMEYTQSTMVPKVDPEFNVQIAKVDCYRYPNGTISCGE